jgi:competence protein CoiA
MRFALVDGLKKEPAPRLAGICKSCDSPMVAKCGRHNLWHWAHKSRVHCDPWWEPETEWHRAWKNHFPEDWQEVVCFDSATGEKHIADVQTSAGLVIEFQHSVITAEELQSREQFYDNIVWIVDGCRSEFDKSYFEIGLGKALDLADSPTVHPVEWFGRSKLLANWAVATKPVFIDFGRDIVWRLASFDPSTKTGFVSPSTKLQQVSDFLHGERIPRVRRN